jgi:pimeloyl-ACP methyl ester carboxylesterase
MNRARLAGRARSVGAPRKAGWAIILWIIAYLIGYVALVPPEPDCTVEPMPGLCDGLASLYVDLTIVGSTLMWFVGLLILLVIWWLSRPRRPASTPSAVTVMLLLVILLPTAAAASDPSVVPSAGSTVAADLPVLPPESFYASGGPVEPGPIGEILDRVELQAPDGARKWAVIYRSTALDGTPVGVSGLIVAPDEPLPAGAPRRSVLSVAHGTSGLADACAPSRGPSDGLVTSAMPLLGQGFVLAVTDYEGLGTPGPHPYIVGRSAGRSVLDAAVAVGTMPETGAGATTVLIGGSQGGHAVLWAADMAATEAPGLGVIGAVAFAPAGDLEAIAGFDRSAESGPDAWSSVIALVSAWNQVYDLPLDVLTSEALAVAPSLATECSVDVTSPPVLVDLRTRPDWLARLRENTPASVRTDVPVLIIQGDADQVVPIETTRSLVARMCAVGDVVDLRVIPGADHSGSVSATSVLAAVSWVGERLAGTPARSTCPNA